MTTIVGSWELGWNAPIKEIEQWELVLREFNVTELWMWPVTGIQVHEPGVTLHERQTLGEILAEVSGDRVFVEPRNDAHPATLDSEWLHEFAHPADPVYIFGSAYHNPVIAHKREGDRQVTIKTERDDGVLWPHQCLLVVLYDRMAKAWP
jgi:hypothetical protein